MSAITSRCVHPDDLVPPGAPSTERDEIVAVDPTVLHVSAIESRRSYRLRRVLA